MPGFEIAHGDNGRTAAVTPAKKERLISAAADALHSDETSKTLPCDVGAAPDAAPVAA